MHISFSDDRDWLVVELVGDAGSENNTEWTAFRADFPWQRASNVVIDVTGVVGASDRMVGTLMGITADGHHRGGQVLVVGVGDELAARIAVLGMTGYIRIAMSVEQARAGLDVA